MPTARPYRPAPSRGNATRCPSGPSYSTVHVRSTRRTDAHDVHPGPNSPTRSERELNVRAKVSPVSSPPNGRSASTSTKFPSAVVTGSAASPAVTGNPKPVGSAPRSGGGAGGAGTARSAVPANP